MIATHRRSAEMTENPHVDHILKREKPADLPVQAPTNMSWSSTFKIAKARSA
jgi:hypothetical protein